MSAYATAADLVARYDIDVVGELATDDRVPLSREDIIAHANVSVALASASGDVDSRLRVGGRYTPAQLADLDDNSTAHLKDIVCAIAMAKLFRRRPGVHSEMAKALREEADEYLKRLAQGEDVFGLSTDTSHIDASIPQISGPTSIDIEQRNFLAARLAGRHVPNIADMNPTYLG